MQAINAGRQEYPLGGWQRGFSLVIGLIAAGGGVLLIYTSLTKPNGGSLLFMAIVPIAFGVYLLATALRSRLVIDGTRVEVHYGFSEKTADLSEIEGYRTISTRNGSFWQL